MIHSFGLLRRQIERRRPKPYDFSLRDFDATHASGRLLQLSLPFNPWPVLEGELVMAFATDIKTEAHAATGDRNTGSRWLARFWSRYRPHLGFALAAAAVAVGWYGRDSRDISAEHGIGYFLGVVSVTCMAMLLVYPLRKRLRWLRFWQKQKKH